MIGPLGIIWLTFGLAFGTVLVSLAYWSFVEWWKARKWAGKYHRTLKR